MRTSSAPASDASEELAEQLTSPKKKLSRRENDAARFLRKRSAKNANNDYHSCHKPTSIAEIPSIRNAESPDRPVSPPFEPIACGLSEMKKSILSDADADMLKTQLPHLHFDTVLNIFSTYGCNIDATIAVGKLMSDVDLVPPIVKEIFVSGVAIERYTNPTRSTHYKEFYMKKYTCGTADTPSMVDFYYGQKNLLGRNWRVEHGDYEYRGEAKSSREKYLNEMNITQFARDPSLPAKQTRGQKAAATRLANLKLYRRREGSFQEREIDSDTVSVSSLSERTERSEPEQKEEASAEEGTQTTCPPTAPSPSSSGSVSVSSVSSTSTATCHHPRTLKRPRIAPSTPRIHVVPLVANGTPVSASPARKRRKKTADEKQVGPKRDYPNRDRKKPAFFEQ
ncbi:unnamed protein product [Caenorhabditis sp. 36 PRJEB53466]|nr:unnamed protein product [Caenorhabditis sp. 36 PRJEB53466]